MRDQQTETAKRATEGERAREREGEMALGLATEKSNKLCER